MAEYADEADYAVEPVSDPEKLVIAEHMLMSSPPGQFWDVLTGKPLFLRSTYVCPVEPPGGAGEQSRPSVGLACASCQPVQVTQTRCIVCLSLSWYIHHLGCRPLDN